MTTNKNDNCFDYYEAKWNDANNKALTIRGISETASADQVMQACQAFARLLKYPLLNVYIDDKNEVIYDAEDAEAHA